MRPYRYDIVGSFLRPDYLKDARAEHAEGTLSADQLREVEDKAIKELVEKEKAVGLKAVTDGELRRRYWHLDFLASLVGVEEIKADHWSVAFKGHQPKAATLEIVGKIDFDENSEFLDHFSYLKEIAGDVDCKMTIPSPAMLHLICCVRGSEIALAYQKAIKAFYARGCRYLQFDDTSWGEFCDQNKRDDYASRGLDLDQIAKNYVKMINEALEAKPEDMTITMHICRGNFRSTWFSSGGYEPVAETLFGGCKIDGFFLEYDSDRSGDFKPLRFIKDQKVVLGLVTSKDPELEDKTEIKERIKEAAQYVALDQLCLSPQCGFSSTEEGNILTDEDQWKKMTLIKEIAEEVWG